MKVSASIILILCIILKPASSPILSQTKPEKRFDDIASSITVDKAGNVYVTGSSRGIAGDFDFATVKYNSSGVQEWATRYDGTLSSDDQPVSMALTPSGDIYVTGKSKGTDTDFDYATVKYNPDGEELWSARYNGTGNSDDQPAALSVEPSGGVYVTGKSKNERGDYDYTTVRYGSKGTEQWIARYDGPGASYDEATAIAVAPSGDIYVTGRGGRRIGASLDFNYSTVKYDENGNEQWVTDYGFKEYYKDMPTAVGIDRDGYILVTGYSIDRGTKEDFATIKYNPEGEERWTSRYNSPGNFVDWALALALDPAGNVYVTGWSGSHPNYDFVTVKYSPDGVQRWATRYDGPANSFDWAAALAVDDKGNVYVTGKSKGNDGKYDFATIKYNKSGKEEWVTRYNNSVLSDDRAIAVTIDASGYVYVLGSCKDKGGDNNYATIKYNSAGETEWVAIYSDGQE